MQKMAFSSGEIYTPMEYLSTHPLAEGGYEVLPEQVSLTHAPSGVQLGSSQQRLADAALASWRSGPAAISASIGTSVLSLSTRSSDVDLKEFLVQRGRHPLQGLHKAAAQGDHYGIMRTMKQQGPDAPINELDANDCTPLMYAVLSESRQAIEMLLNFSARREQTDSEGRTAVHYAAFYGKSKSLKFLIDTAADWKSVDLYGRTPLHWACYSKSTRCLSTLIKHVQTVFGDINLLDSEGMSPVHCAAQFERPRHIQLLAEAGCDFTTVDIEHKTALHWTVGNKDVTCVQAILDTYPPLLNRQDRTGSTLLHLAASNGSTHIVETILNIAGIDLDLRDNAEQTALHCSSQAGHAEITRLLLTFGALDTCIDSQGYIALHYAVQSNSTATVKAFAVVTNLSHLPDANEGKTPLIIAAQNASHSVLKTLLQNKAVMKAINQTDSNGYTALHLVCICGSEECTTVLLSYGADPNVQDSLLQTPLMIACMAGHTACIHPLIAGGAKPQLVDSEGHTPLLKAVLYGQSSAVKSLTFAGVNLDAQDSTGNTALHMAAYSGDEASLMILLESGANPDIQDVNGLSALHMAAVEGQSHCIAPLVDHGATINLVEFSDERLTPLDYAVRNGHSECEDELKTHGAVMVSYIRDMAATSIQTAYRGYRARKLRATLVLQSKAVTIIAAHVRVFIQRKCFAEMKKRHYAAIKIQSHFRGWQERVLFKEKQAEAQEKDKKLKQMEDFAQLVKGYQSTLTPFPKKTPTEVRVVGREDLFQERRARLEAAMEAREIYKEKQRCWVSFRMAEGQRRKNKARQAEFDRLAAIVADSRTRREYTQSKFQQSISVRSHHHAAIIIQKAFHQMKTRKWWQEKVRARLLSDRRRREHRAAVTIQRTWRSYWKRKIYMATHFRAIYTSPVVALPRPSSALPLEAPSYKRSISITGNPRRKMHLTLQGGFRVPQPIFKSPTALHIQQTSLLQPLNPFSPFSKTKRRSLTSPAATFPTRPRYNTANGEVVALPELLSKVSHLNKKTKSVTHASAEASFRLPQIVPH